MRRGCGDGYANQLTVFRHRVVKLYWMVLKSLERNNNDVSQCGNWHSNY